MELVTSPLVGNCAKIFERQIQKDQSWNISLNKPMQECLKCLFCDKFLSVAPIFNSEIGWICGRCKFADEAVNSRMSRQSLYENIAQFLIFPCSNASFGCKAELQWGDVEEHENTCVYKKLTCPFGLRDFFNTPELCRWTGSGPQLNEHLETCHITFIKKLPEIDFTTTDTNQFFLVKMLKQLMIIIIKCKPPTGFSCSIMVNGTSADCEAYRYQLELFDENRRNSLILRRSRLEDAVAFEENLVNDEKMLSFDLVSIRELLMNPDSIHGRFGVIKKSKREISYADKGPGSDFTYDENFLRELECPICKHYMSGSIQICTSGHSVCQECYEQMHECPTCRKAFNGGRNYTLEKISSLINFPCAFRDAGCSMICSSGRIKEHELGCSFSGLDCFLDCGSTGIINMYKHLNDFHQQSLILSGDFQILDVGSCDPITKSYAMFFGSDIFRVMINFDGDLQCSVQEFGNQNVDYSFELEIARQGNSSEKIIYGKECVPLNAKIWKDCIVVIMDIVEKYISDEDELLFFKIHLKKKV